MNNEETLDAVVHEEEKSRESSPGELLAQKREALGLGIQQVAEDLHITMHYVRALESDAYEKLPGDVFIRGYIRSYSNLLKLDPVVIVDLYSRHTNQTDAPLEVSNTRSRRRRNRNFPWIIISGIAFIGLAVALWYFSSGPGDAATVVPAPARDGAVRTIDNVAVTLPTDPVTAMVNAASAAAEPNSLVVDASAQTEAFAPQITQPLPELANEPAPADPMAELAPVSAPASGQQTPVVSTAVPVQATSLQSSEQSALPSPAPAAADAPAPESPSVRVSTPEPASADEASVPGQTSAPVNALGVSPRVITVDAGGEDLIQISFTGQSMVQIDDRNDKQVYRDVRVAGDVLRLNGFAPFDIILGDASSVELSLNGNRVDFSSSIRIDNSARLTIGL